MNCSTPDIPVPPYLPEFAQTHVCWVDDVIQTSHPLLSPSLSALNLSPHQGLFQWVSSLHQVVKILELQFNISPSNECSGLISFRIDWFEVLSVQRTLESLLQCHRSKASIFQCSSFFMAQLSHPYTTTGKTRVTELESHDALVEDVAGSPPFGAWEFASLPPFAFFLSLCVMWTLQCSLWFPLACPDDAWCRGSRRYRSASFFCLAHCCGCRVYNVLFFCLCYPNFYLYKYPHVVGQSWRISMLYAAPSTLREGEIDFMWNFFFSVWKFCFSQLNVYKVCKSEITS